MQAPPGRVGEVALHLQRVREHRAEVAVESFHGANDDQPSRRGRPRAGCDPLVSRPSPARRPRAGTGTRTSRTRVGRTFVPIIAGTPDAARPPGCGAAPTPGPPWPAARAQWRPRRRVRAPRGLHRQFKGSVPGEPDLGDLLDGDRRSRRDPRPGGRPLADDRASIRRGALREYELPAEQRRLGLRELHSRQVGDLLR